MNTRKTVRPVAAQRSAISPFIVMDMLRAANERAASGKDVLHLEVGQPGLGAPQSVLDTVKDVLQRERLGYTEALGLSQLRARIARHYGDSYGLDIAPERIVVTTGASGGLILAVLVLFNEGAKVGVTEPGYPAYRNILSALGNRPVAIELHSQTGFRLTCDVVETAIRRHNLAGLIIASPANPTGSMIESAELAAIATLCAERGVWLISDEIYHGLSYEKKSETALRANDDAIIVNSFSKYFRLTGWRVGWIVVPPELARPVERLVQNLFISAPSISQFAALAAFEARQDLESRVALYRRNRDFLLNELPKAGIGNFAPADGAFYLYADVSALTDDSVSYCRTLLNETGVAVTPGVDFDPTRGHHFLRISYAGEHADIAEAARRLSLRKI